MSQASHQLPGAAPRSRSRQKLNSTSAIANFMAKAAGVAPSRKSSTVTTPATSNVGHVYHHNYANGGDRRSPRPLDLIESNVHLAQDSLFSSSSGWTNYSGFFNLSVLLLVVSNGRVALENLIKYGVLISPIQWVEILIDSLPQILPLLLIVLLSNVTIVSALVLEIVMSKRLLSNSLGGLLYTILITSHLCIPAAVIVVIESNPFFSSNVLSMIVIQTLKLISYAHVNYWCRLARDEAATNASGEGDGEKSKLYYPANLTLANLYYFLWAPTLCYELRFPRTPKRRVRFIVKRVVELISFSFVMLALSQQWVLPLVKNSMAPFSQMDAARIVERVLKLAIPNHLIWLMFFYLYFHSFCNLVAEVLRFADRKFYLDFWNAETIGEFWQHWNIPVHRWCVRHLYKPAGRNGISKFFAAALVFFVSAFFHEFLVSVPMKMFRLWAFYGMLAQLPLCFFTEHVIKGGRAGNVIMWLSLILGQPMAILMYVHDWYLSHHPAAANLTAAGLPSTPLSIDVDL